ncbi:MAG: tetratricopeptide repeat protein [Gemmatimonadaceae bacterium]|nr:tetratricopeptide repeat protein [Gemmatimonadaceae bacterium]
MKARQHQAIALATLLAGSLLGPGALSAQDQQLQRGQTPGPRFMVPVFRSNERNVGWQFADQLRQRMGQDFMGRTLWIIVKSDIDNALEQSGYSKTEPLNQNDAKQLANLIRAEEYVEGTINKTDAGYEFDGYHLLVRGDGMVQPLPKVTGAKVGDLAKGVSDAIEAARKPIEEVKSCVLKWRQNQYPGASSDAAKGLREYPNSVMSRVCQLEIAASQKQPPDSIIRIGEEITKLHADNRRALFLLSQAYETKKMDEKYISTLTRLLALDPTNIRLTETIVEAIARTGQFAVAKPIIDEAVKLNPGDPNLIRLQYRIYLAIKDYAAAATIGEDMIKTDTAAADTNFFGRQAAAYLAANDTAKALEAASRGTAKFPTNEGLWGLVAQFARQTGQMPVALNAYQKLLAINPKTPAINLQIARIQADQGQVDEALASVKLAQEAGDDKAQVSGIYTAIADRLRKQYDTDKQKPTAQKALEVLKLAEAVQPSETVYFLTGVISFQLGAAVLQEANTAKSCDQSREAKTLFTDAEINLPKGGRTFAQQLGPVMAQLQQYSSYPDQMIKAYCK